MKNLKLPPRGFGEIFSSLFLGWKKMFSVTLLVSLVFALVLALEVTSAGNSACSADYCSNYGGDKTHDVEIQQVETLMFEVNNLPDEYRVTEWYVDGDYKGADYSNDANSFADSNYFHTDENLFIFSAAATKIEALVYEVINGNQILEERHVWNLSVCQCSSGECCDGCNYKSSGEVCDANASFDYDYGCSVDENDITRRIRFKDRYCSGSSGSCNGSLSPFWKLFSSWGVYESCDSSEYCSGGECVQEPVCPNQCTSGQERCSDNVSETCVQDEDKCWSWENDGECEANIPNCADKDEEGNCVIRVLFAYTNDLKEEGKLSAIENNSVSWAIDIANDSFRNSSINLVFQKAGFIHAEYSESFLGMSTDLERLITKDDGDMDTIHTIRDKVAADVVILLSTGDTLLQGFERGQAEGIEVSEDKAFAVIAASMIGNDFVLAHEIGHLIGAKHNPEEYEKTNKNVIGSSHGYINISEGIRTIMAVNDREKCPLNDRGFKSCQEISYWSSPDLPYQGITIGDEYRNNAQKLREKGPLVANFRIGLGTKSIITPSSGGTCHSGDNTASTIFPLQATTQNLSITITESEDQSIPFKAYDFQAKNEQAEIVSNFAKDVEVVIQYNPEDLGDLKESTLKIKYYNEASSEWEVIPSTVDTVNKTVTGITNHFSKFAIFGESENANNTPPTPTAENLAIPINYFSTTQVSHGDTDENDTHTYEISITPEHGQALITASGLVIYAPEKDYDEVDSLEITVTDNHGASGKVEIEINSEFVTNLVKTEALIDIENNTESSKNIKVENNILSLDNMKKETLGGKYSLASFAEEGLVYEGLEHIPQTVFLNRYAEGANPEHQDYNFKYQQHYENSGNIRCSSQASVYYADGTVEGFSNASSDDVPFYHNFSAKEISKVVFKINALGINNASIHSQYCWFEFPLTPVDENNVLESGFIGLKDIILEDTDRDLQDFNYCVLDADVTEENDLVFSVDGNIVELGTSFQNPMNLNKNVIKNIKIEFARASEQVTPIVENLKIVCAKTASSVMVPDFELCTDSDNGKDYKTKGETCIGSECKTDQCMYPDCSVEAETDCLGGDQIIEHYCDVNEIKSEAVNCENGCNDGTCLEYQTCKSDADCFDSEVCELESGKCNSELTSPWLIQQPLVYYSLTENAEDKSGNENHGTTNGGINFGENGGDFDGADGYIDTGIIQNSEQKTYSWWAKSTDTSVYNIISTADYSASKVFSIKANYPSATNRLRNL